MLSFIQYQLGLSGPEEVKESSPNRQSPSRELPAVHEAASAFADYLADPQVQGKLNKNKSKITLTREDLRGAQIGRLFNDLPKGQHASIDALIDSFVEIQSLAEVESETGISFEESVWQTAVAGTAYMELFDEQGSLRTEVKKQLGISFVDELYKLLGKETVNNSLMCSYLMHLASEVTVDERILKLDTAAMVAVIGRIFNGLTKGLKTDSTAIATYKEVLIAQAKQPLSPLLTAQMQYLNECFRVSHSPEAASPVQEMYEVKEQDLKSVINQVEFQTQVLAQKNSNLEQGNQQCRKEDVFMKDHVIPKHLPWFAKLVMDRFPARIAAIESLLLSDGGKIKDKYALPLAEIKKAFVKLEEISLSTTKQGPFQLDENGKPKIKGRELLFIDELDDPNLNSVFNNIKTQAKAMVLASKSFFKEGSDNHTLVMSLIPLCEEFFNKYHRNYKVELEKRFYIDFYLKAQEEKLADDSVSTTVSPIVSQLTSFSRQLNEEKDVSPKGSTPIFMPGVLQEQFDSLQDKYEALAIVNDDLNQTVLKYQGEIKLNQLSEFKFMQQIQSLEEANQEAVQLREQEIKLSHEREFKMAEDYQVKLQALAQDKAILNDRIVVLENEKTAQQDQMRRLSQVNMRLDEQNKQLRNQRAAVAALRPPESTPLWKYSLGVVLAILGLAALTMGVAAVYGLPLLSLNLSYWVGVAYAAVGVALSAIGLSYNLSCFFGDQASKVQYAQEVRVANEPTILEDISIEPFSLPSVNNPQGVPELRVGQGLQASSLQNNSIFGRQNPAVEVDASIARAVLVRRRSA